MSIANPVSPSKYLHGDNFLLAVLPSGGTETYFNAVSVDLTDSVEAAETTNSGGNGWKSYIPGVRSITGTLKFDYDLANKPHLSPYMLKTGNTVQLRIVADAQAANNLQSSDVTTPSQIWVGQALMTGTQFTEGPNAGILSVSMPFVSVGPWTTPTT